MDRLIATLRPRLRLLAAPTAAIASCRRGATAIEYGLIAALVVIAVMVSIGAVRDSLVGLPLQQIVDVITAMLA